MGVVVVTYFNAWWNCRPSSVQFVWCERGLTVRWRHVSYQVDVITQRHVSKLLAWSNYIVAAAAAAAGFIARTQVKHADAAYCYRSIVVCVSVADIISSKAREPRAGAGWAAAHPTITLGGQPMYAAHPKNFPNIIQSTELHSSHTRISG